MHVNELAYMQNSLYVISDKVVVRSTYLCEGRANKEVVRPARYRSHGMKHFLRRWYTTQFFVNILTKVC